jgi:hypothetical protein
MCSPGRVGCAVYLKRRAKKAGSAGTEPLAAKRQAVALPMSYAGTLAGTMHNPFVLFPRDIASFVNYSSRMRSSAHFSPIHDCCTWPKTPPHQIWANYQDRPYDFWSKYGKT